MNAHAQRSPSSPRLEIIHLRPVKPTPPGLLAEIGRSIEYLVSHQAGGGRRSASTSTGDGGILSKAAVFAEQKIPAPFVKGDTLSPSDGEALHHCQQPPVSVRFFNRGGVATDLAIHIHIAPGIRDPAVIELGARLVAALEPHGMVAHTVWYEAPVQRKGAF